MQRSVCDDSCVRIDHNSYAARSTSIGANVLVRLFDRRTEIRDLLSQQLLHPRPSEHA